MRVVEATQRYPPALGGVETVVEAIARGLFARGHSVEIVTTDVARERPFTRLSVEPRNEPFPVRRHRGFRTLPLPHGLGIVAPGMARDLWTVRADIVHAHAFGVAPTWLASFARRFREIPLVIETHADAGRGTSGSRAYARAVARLTLWRADRIVVHTRIEENLMASLGVDPSRLVLIPNGLDLAEFAGATPRVHRAGSITILFVGRLSAEQKGLEPLLRAFAQLPRDSGTRLRLVGQDWGGQALVVRLARELGVQDRVVLTGPLPRVELVHEYANADLFVLPSLFEPYGIVLAEAMAAGLPIVASRVGGIPEVVAEGENALLCPPNDPGALAAALDRLARDASLRTRMGQAGVERVRQFAWDRILPRWIDLFESVIAQGPR
jgi:glycosyltransferase involved in cell wall biosynthesis